MAGLALSTIPGVQGADPATPQSAGNLLDSLVLTGLAGHIRSAWERNLSAKQHIHQELLRCLRQRTGVYEADVLAAIREQGGSEIYMQLTDVKCRAASSWLRDVLLPADDKAWSIDPTPTPNLPPSVISEIARVVREQMLAMTQQGQPVTEGLIRQALLHTKERMEQQVMHEARMRVRRMEQRMEDQLEEGGWRQCMHDFIDDFVTYPAAIVKGPVLRRQRKLSWSSDGQPIVQEKIVKRWQRRSPFDIYPAAGARTLQEGDLFDLYRLSPQELDELSEADGFNEAVIAEVIELYGQKGYREWQVRDSERDLLEGKDLNAINDEQHIDALNYWGVVRGSLLRSWDPQLTHVGQEVEPHKLYHIEAWMIGPFVIKAVINPHPLGERPYSSASYISVPGTIWGRAIPYAIRDDQRMVNAAARSLSNNMGIASGPQVIINDASRIPQGQNITSLFPWKIWQFTSDRNPVAGHRPAMEFHQPRSLVQELLALFEHFSRAADEHAALPAYIYGGTERVEGAGSTASGLAMLMGQASKSMKLVIGNLDVNIIEPRIKALHTFNMLFEFEPDMAGDVIIKARGSSSLLIREQRQLRLNDFLAIIGNLPAAIGILGPKGLAAVLREVGKDMLDIPIDMVVPDPEMMSFQPQQGPSPEELEDQRERAKLEVEQQRESQRMSLEDARENRRLEQDAMFRQKEIDLKREEIAARAMERAEARVEQLVSRQRDERVKRQEKSAQTNDQMMQQLAAMSMGTGPVADAAKPDPAKEELARRDAEEKHTAEVLKRVEQTSGPVIKALEQQISELKERLTAESEGKGKGKDQKQVDDAGKPPLKLVVNVDAKRGPVKKKIALQKGADGRLSGAEVTEEEIEDDDE